MRSRSRVLVLVAIACVVALMPGVAVASWGGGGSGSAYSTGILMPDGEQPSVSVTGRNAIVTWPASYVNASTQVNGYLVKRYDAGSTPQGPGADCSGTINVLTCTEKAVPTGSWTYAVTPKQNQWLGGESPVSGSVSVAPPSLTLTGVVNLTTLPGTLSGTIDSFITGQSVTFRMDDPVVGPLLTGSIAPDPVPFSGSSSVSVAVPAGTANGAHTLYAIGDRGDVASAPFGVNVVDTRPPTISRSVIQKTTGGTGGYIRQNGTYYVYAQVIDTGSPAPSGVATVTADVNTITTGATSVNLASGSWTVNGQTYNYRSASTTANNPLSAGSKTYSIRATDVAANSATQSFSVTVDNTRPKGSNVGTTNASAGTVGKAETGDTITYTWDEAMEPNSFLSGWSGGAQAVTVRLIDNNAGDRLQIRNAADTALLPFGTVRMERTDYVATTVGFTSSSMTMSGTSITVTLGTPSGATGTAAGTGTITWTPDTIATDLAGNACRNTSVAATGNPQKAF